MSKLLHVYMKPSQVRPVKEALVSESCFDFLFISGATVENVDNLKMVDRTKLEISVADDRQHFMVDLIKKALLGSGGYGKINVLAIVDHVDVWSNKKNQL